MNPYGKIFGAILGLLISWPYGIFFGAIAGHYFFDRKPLDARTKASIDNIKYYFKAHSDKLNIKYLFSKKQSFFGKIFGGVLGLVFFNFFGLLIGAAAGHILIDCNDFSPDEIIKNYWQDLLEKAYNSKLLNPFRNIAKSQEAKDVVFLQNMASLAAKLSKVDGVVLKEEIASFKSIFNISKKDYKKIAIAFDSAKNTSQNFEKHAKQIFLIFKTNPKKLEKTIEYLFIIAASDEEPNDKEVKFIQDVADIFKISNEQFDNIFEKATGSKSEPRSKRSSKKSSKSFNPYKILGISSKASNDEIKKAWKKLIREYHPDVLSSKGLSTKKIELATKKMAEINAAYDKIATDRGIKQHF